MDTKKGFTLIELLVVIAIIGILAGMVVVNMSSAPNAAKNSLVKSYLDQMKASAMVYQSAHGSYTGWESDADYTKLQTNINDNASSTGLFTTTTAEDFCSIAPLLSPATGYWCVDSNGYSGATSSAAYCTANVQCVP